MLKDAFSRKSVLLKAGLLKAGACALALGLIAAGTQQSFAHGPGGRGGVGMGAGGGLGFNDASAGHFNNNDGRANTNGPNALDRDTGIGRAQDRMSTQGLDNSKAASSSTSDKDAKGDRKSKSVKDKND
jgi:hypothetical protein